MDATRAPSVPGANHRVCRRGVWPWGACPMRQAVTSHLGHVRVIFCYEQKGIGPNLPVSTRRSQGDMLYSLATPAFPCLIWHLTTNLNSLVWTPSILTCARDLNAGLHCIRSYTRRCMSITQRQHFNKLYQGTSEVIHELCSEGAYQEGTYVFYYGNQLQPHPHPLLSVCLNVSTPTIHCLHASLKWDTYDQMTCAITTPTPIQGGFFKSNNCPLRKYSLVTSTVNKLTPRVNKPLL